MKVLIAGYLSNNTEVVVRALKILGHCKSHGFHENATLYYEEWKKILQDGPNEKTFLEMYKNVDVIYELPALYYWKDILGAFPDSKVILLQQNKEKWLEHWINSENRNWVFTKLNSLLSSTANNVEEINQLIKNKIFNLETNTKRPDEENMLRSYEAHCKSVVADCPNENLLIFNIAEEWDPLCKYLNCEKPDQDFPSLKSSPIHANTDLKIHTEAYMSYLFITIVIALSMTLVNIYLIMFP